jgi:hypothetical protein
MPVSAHPSGATIAIYAQPRASKTAVSGTYDQAVRLQVAAPPVDGKANEEIIRFLGKQLGVRKSKIEIISGHSGRRKVVLVRGGDPRMIRDRLGV